MTRAQLRRLSCLEKLDEDHSWLACGGKHKIQSFLFTSATQLVREYFLHCVSLKQVLFLLFSTA